jgi:hypothetical protein
MTKMAMRKAAVADKLRSVGHSKSTLIILSSWLLSAARIFSHGPLWKFCWPVNRGLDRFKFDQNLSVGITKANMKLKVATTCDYKNFALIQVPHDEANCTDQSALASR